MTSIRGSSLFISNRVPNFGKEGMGSCWHFIILLQNISSSRASQRQPNFNPPYTNFDTGLWEVLIPPTTSIKKPHSTKWLPRRCGGGWPLTEPKYLMSQKLITSFFPGYLGETTTQSFAESDNKKGNESCRPWDGVGSGETCHIKKNINKYSNIEINFMTYNCENMGIERLRSMVPALLEEHINIACFQGTQSKLDADYKCGPYHYYQQPAGTLDTDSKAGVAIIMHESLNEIFTIKKMKVLPFRCLSIRLYNNKFSFQITSAYAPGENHDHNHKRLFWKTLQTHIKTTPKRTYQLLESMPTVI